MGFPPGSATPGWWSCGWTPPPCSAPLPIRGERHHLRLDYPTGLYQQVSAAYREWFDHRATTIYSGSSPGPGPAWATPTMGRHHRPRGTQRVRGGTERHRQDRGGVYHGPILPAGPLGPPPSAPCGGRAQHAAPAEANRRRPGAGRRSGLGPGNARPRPAALPAGGLADGPHRFPPVRVEALRLHPGGAGPARPDGGRPQDRQDRGRHLLHDHLAYGVHEGVSLFANIGAAYGGKLKETDKTYGYTWEGKMRTVLTWASGSATPPNWARRGRGSSWWGASCATTTAG